MDLGLFFGLFFGPFFGLFFGLFFFKGWVGSFARGVVYQMFFREGEVGSGRGGYSIMPEFLKTGLAKIMTHFTTWQIK